MRTERAAIADSRRWFGGKFLNEYQAGAEGELDKQEFLQIVSQAVRSGNRYRVPLTADDTPGRLGPEADLELHLAREFEAVGGEACIAEDRAAASEFVQSVLNRHASAKVLVSESGSLAKLPLEDLLAGKTIVRPSDLKTMDHQARRDLIFECELGISTPDWAIAETGSLVYAGSPTQTRATSLLPPVNLAIVSRENILSDLLDFSEQVCCDLDSLPSNLAIVTGPSKTGDIELKLTRGVHGPGDIYLLILK